MAAALVVITSTHTIKVHHIKLALHSGSMSTVCFVLHVVSYISCWWTFTKTA